MPTSSREDFVNGLLAGDSSGNGLDVRLATQLGIIEQTFKNYRV